MNRRILLLATAALATGCATPGSSLPPNASVAVVSMVGNELKLKQVGITAFGNSEKRTNVDAWNIDSSVQEAASQLLSTHGRRVSAASAGAAQEIGAWSFVNFTSRYSFAGGAAALRSVAMKSNADYLILIMEVPTGFGDPFFRTNQSIAGYGVYVRSGAGVLVFADLSILLIDGKTGELVDRRRAYEGVPGAGTVWLDAEDAAQTAQGESPGEIKRVLESAVSKGLQYIGAIPKQ